MNLPFSHDAFLDVFGAYNRAFWPVVALLWIVTAVAAVRWLRRGRTQSRAAFILLAAHWAWSGVAYHWMFFRRINPAAGMFGALFVLQAGSFVWVSRRPRAAMEFHAGLRGWLGAALVAYGLAYPLLGAAFGLRYPRMPVFAVPCPTTLVTAGMLLAASGVPRAVKIVPILWAFVGSAAAFALGIVADTALIVAGGLLAMDTLAPHALGRRS